MTRNNPDFDNSAYWDRRYKDNPVLGSGIGSRGKNMRHKRKIIESFLRKIAPTTVLDIGCGDHEVMKHFENISGYTGIDVSAIAVADNTRKYPARIFRCLDFAACDVVQNLRSDAVLCLEVLIHQHNREAYDGLVRNIVSAAKKGGLVSAYMFDPRPEISSDIIAYHEPIIDTLSRAGAKKISVENRSLESDCLAFVSFRT